jgi:hypothetical protein
MSRSQLFTSIALVCATCCTPSGFAYSQQAAPEKQSTDVDPIGKLDAFVAAAIKPDAKDSPLRKLQKELCSEQATALGKMKVAIAIGKIDAPGDFNKLCKLSASLTKNLMELMDKPEDKLKCLELRLDAFKQLEKIMESRIAVGADVSQNLNLAKADRIKAEIKLLKFKTELEKGKK